MSIQNTISDLRNVKRSLALRAETDPAKVVEILEKVMRDAVVAQASGSRSFQKKSLEEMIQIRKDLTAGQINAGASTGPMVGIYSNLLDQMNSMQKENSKSTKNSDKAFKHLSNSIPSADTFISALMTANPLVGYGIKISRDIYRSSKAFSQNRSKEGEEKLKILKKQESYIQEQMKIAKAEEKAAEEKQKNPDGGTKEKKGPKTPLLSETFEKSLEAIRAEVELVKLEIAKSNSELNSAFISMSSDKPIVVESPKPEPKLVGRGPDGKFIKLDQQPVNQQEEPKETEQVVEVLDQVNDSIVEQTQQDKELSLDEIEEQEKANKSKKRDEKFKDFETGTEKKVDLEPVNDSIKKESGGFAKLLEGLVAPLMILLRTGLVAFGVAVGSFLLTFIAIPALIATAVYKFLDGFFNAEAIIGKAATDITMFDRVKAGVANIWGTIFKIVDWVTNLFGFDFIDTKDIEKRIYKVFDNAQTVIVETFEKTIDYIKNKYDDISKSVMGFVDDVFGIVDRVALFINDKYTQLTKFFDDLSTKGVFETFKDLLMEDKSQGAPPAYTLNPNEYRGDVPLVPNPVAQVPTQGPKYRGDVPLVEPTTPAPVKVVPAPEKKIEIDAGKPLNQSPTEKPSVLQQESTPNGAIEFKQNKGNEVGNSMKKAEIETEKKAAPVAPPIINAPSQNNNSVNNHNYMGPPSTSNPDQSFRDMRGANRYTF